MDINHSKNTNTGRIYTQGGNLHIGDMNFHKSLEYKELQERIEELKELVANAPSTERKLKHSKKLEKLRDQMETFKWEIISLAELFQHIDLDIDRLKTAKQHFENGEYREARAVLNAEKMGNELNALLHQKERLQIERGQNKAHLENKADEFLILAKLTAIDFNSDKRFDHTIKYFDLSISAHRGEGNLFAYAKFLQNHNQNNEAIIFYQEVLSIYRELAIIEPYVYLPKLAQTLNNLGVLQQSKNDYIEAEQNYIEALSIREKLGEESPHIYLVDVAGTLNNLGILQKDKKEYEKAEDSYIKALSVFEGIEKVFEDEVHYFKLAAPLTNLAILKQEDGKYDESQKYYEQALSINRQLAQSKPKVYKPEMAGILNNLGLLQKDKEDYSNSILNLKKSLSIYEDFTTLNPYSYLPKKVMVLYNLATVYRANKEYNKALVNYNEVLLILNDLLILNKEVYQSKIGMVRNALANLQYEIHDFDSAEQNFNYALLIYRELVKLNPKVYQPELAITLVDCSRFYSTRDKKIALSMGNEAVSYLQPVSHINYFDNYLKKITLVLEEIQSSKKDIL